MKITKRQLRRIIREAISGKGLVTESVDMEATDALAAGDTNAATKAILSNYMMDDTWRMEEDALEDMLIELGPNPTPDDVGAVIDEWLGGVRAGTWRPKTGEEREADWARGADPRTDYSRRF